MLNAVGALDGAQALRTDIGQRMLITALWMEADETAKVKLTHWATGTGIDDLEQPLPDDEFLQDVARFATQGCMWTLAPSERLCEVLFGRLKRESRKGTHSVLPLARIRTAAEVSSKEAAGKLLNIAQGLSALLPQGPLPECDRPGGVRDHHIMVWLMNILMIGAGPWWAKQ